MARPKDNDFPPYLWPDGDRGGFVVRNPLNGKAKRFRADQLEEARATALDLNSYIEKRRARELLDAGKAKLVDVIDRWKREQLHHQPWDVSTRKTAEQRLARIALELGADEVLMEELTVVDIGRWLAKTAPRADPFNKWRQILVLLWSFAVGDGLVKSNEAEKVPRRSISRKIESNRKRRAPLDIDGFAAVYAQADPLLQLAMEISLVTLQARNEVCNLRHVDFRDGWLYVIRDKVSAESDMAFIRIRLTPELEAFQARARKLDDVASPYLIHRRPERMQRRWLAGKEHWTFVNPDYLTRAFADARDKVAAFAALATRERPVFHEIRGLGSRLAKDHGMAKDDIRGLMTHSDQKTTAIYLEGGRDAVTDESFIKVAAPFTVRELLGGNGR